VNLRFDCPGCEQPARADVPGRAEWQCPSCDHVLRLPETLSGPDVAACPVCGNHELYKKKDFPHWLGMSILTVASAAFFLLQLTYHPTAAWIILIGSAVLDGGLYLWVGDAVVCYRCGASLHGLPTPAAHAPFELGIAERYRQERLRRELLRKEKGVS
jgi:DNA-directed RNA polymerase subunit RPC12/RpoP